jgi:hypothetical protein
MLTMPWTGNFIIYENSNRLEEIPTVANCNSMVECNIILITPNSVNHYLFMFTNIIHLFRQKEPRCTFRILNQITREADEMSWNYHIILSNCQQLFTPSRTDVQLLIALRLKYLRRGLKSSSWRSKRPCLTIYATFNLRQWRYWSTPSFSSLQKIIFNLGNSLISPVIVIHRF